MDIGVFRLGHRFPGEAGELQQKGQTLGLIRELGDNYGQYHDDLRQQLEAAGPRAEPADYEGDFPGYQEAGRRIDDILHAERALRLCVLLRSGAKDLDRVYSIPLVDAQERLVDAREGKPDGAPPAPLPRPTRLSSSLDAPPEPTPRAR